MMDAAAAAAAAAAPEPGMGTDMRQAREAARLRYEEAVRCVATQHTIRACRASYCLAIGLIHSYQYCCGGEF